MGKCPTAVPRRNYTRTKFRFVSSAETILKPVANQSVVTTLHLGKATKRGRRDRLNVALQWNLTSAPSANANTPTGGDLVESR